MAKKSKSSVNSGTTFAVTLYLKEFTKEMKEKDGTEPKTSDFVDAFHEMQNLDDDKMKIKSMVCQVERGENGTIHLQGYMQMKGKVRISTLQNRLKNHTKFHGAILVAKGGSRANLEYCTKPTGDWKYRDGKVKHSEQLCQPMWINEDAFKDVKKGMRSDLQAAITMINNGQTIFDVAEQLPTTWIRNYRGITDYAFKKKLKDKSMRKGFLIVLWGAAGTGKSYAARHIISKQLGYTNADVFSLSLGSGKDPWYDGYNGEKILLIDDYEHGAIKRNIMLRTVDEYSITPPVKGGFTIAEWDYVIITSNYPPTELWTHYEYCERAQTMVEMPDPAMMSRIDNSICFNSMPDMRGNTSAYHSHEPTDLQSLRSILPATLAHDTNESQTLVSSGAMQGCGDAITTEKNTEIELTQYLENDTLNGTQLDLAHDQIFTTEKEETA